LAKEAVTDEGKTKSIGLFKNPAWRSTQDFGLVVTDQ
jgi:hypothetical protein